MRRYRSYEEQKAYEQKNPFVDCPLCGEPIRKAGLKRHQKGAPCTAERNKRSIRVQGLHEVDRHNETGFVRALGLPMEEMLASYSKPAYREASKHIGYFVPQWVGAFLQCCKPEGVAEYSPEVVDSENAFRSYDYSQCAKALVMASRDPELQDMVSTTVLALPTTELLAESMDALVLSLAMQADQEGVALPPEAEKVALKLDERITKWHREALKRKSLGAKQRAQAAEEDRKRRECMAIEQALAVQAEADEQAMERDRLWGVEP